MMQGGILLLRRDIVFLMVPPFLISSSPAMFSSDCSDSMVISGNRAMIPEHGSKWCYSGRERCEVTFELSPFPFVPFAHDSDELTTHFHPLSQNRSNARLRRTIGILFRTAET
jgi:hypothetical protein